MPLGDGRIPNRVPFFPLDLCPWAARVDAVLRSEHRPGGLEPSMITDRRILEPLIQVAPQDLVIDPAILKYLIYN